MNEILKITNGDKISKTAKWMNEIMKMSQLNFWGNKIEVMKSFIQDFT